MSECATCATGPTRRYCAPARCYCGHTDCHAYASWIDVDSIPLSDVTPTTSSTWKEREESTWIDKL
jgi:hypothetical protein